MVKATISEEKQQLNKQNADMNIVLDFMNQTSVISSKDTMIQKTLELFHILFSPEGIIYYDISKSGEIYQYKYENFTFTHANSSLPDICPSKDQKYIWSESGSDLILAIQSGNILFGYLDIINFKFSKFKGRYLQLILLLTQHWGHVFTNIKLNERIRMEQERFQIVAEYSSDWEVWFEESGLLKYNSPSCKKLTGYSAEAVKNFYDFMKKIVHSNDLANWNVFIMDLQQKDTSHPFEFRIKLPNGQIRWLQLVSQKISSDLRGFLGFRGSLRDVTDRKLAEESVSILRGMLPICSFCKKIRSDEGYWNQIEDYIRDHSEATFSHGVCPECAMREYGIDF